ncbi:hypothetical protein GCM10027447_04280 [Glycomyces halotolerans]
MAASPKYRSLWGEDRMVPYPKEAWLELGFPADALPDGDEVPMEVEVVYTTFLEGDLEAYDPIQLTTDDGKLDILLIVVGAVQDNPNLLYALDPKTGEIVQFDLVEHDIQGVNSNFRCFVEFLYHFALFVEGDEGKAGRAERAAELRATLQRIDPNAFQDDAWWPLVFDQLMS